MIERNVRLIDLVLIAITVAGASWVFYDAGKRAADKYYSTRCVHQWIIGLDSATTPSRYAYGKCLAAVESDTQPGKVHMLLINCDEVPR
jgi:hypothetical protein